ncbi:MAG TPA: hypothetical protein VFY99_11670 [Solirubrobacterales bacterium]
MTVGLGEYVAGAAELVLVAGAAAFAAVRVRGRLLPGWSGAPARLAEAVLGLVLVVWVAELLGLFGLFEEGVFVAVAVVAGIAIGVLSGPARPGEPLRAPSPTALELVVTLGIAALLFAHWGFETQQSLNNAITNFDSRWYHLPFSAEFAQSGSATELVRTDPLFLNWFYPQVSELLGGATILLTERDTLALFLNLGWLALALLSAWCVGRPYGRGPHAVAAVAVLVEAHNLVVREPGTGKNDVAAAALLLAAAAILVTASRRRDAGTVRAVPGGALAVAGVAAGLACGVKLTALAPVAALTVAVVVLAPTGARWRSAGRFGVPMVAAGGFWYLRNLVAAGNPLPWITEVGPLSLPGPERLDEAREPFSVAHYATDFDVWREWFGPGLHDAFGVLWPVVIGAAVAGMAIALVRRLDPPDPMLRALGAVGLFGVLAYLFTPLGAAGSEGMPVAFEINVRFAIPPLLLGLALFATVLPARSAPARWALLAGTLAVLAITNDPFDVLSADERAAGAGIAFVFVLLPAGILFLAGRGMPRPVVAAALAGVGALALAAGYLIQDSYLEDRFAGFESEAHVDEAWRFANGLDGARIGLAGTTAGFYRYGFYGGELSNEVVYLGRKGPKGAFSAIPGCAEFRAAVNDAGLDYLVTSPELNFDDQATPLDSPEEGWLGDDPPLRPVSEEGGVTVWRVAGELDPATCPAEPSS